MALSSELHNLRQGPANPDGKVFGVSPSDPIGFFGATPVVQPAGENQASVTLGAQDVATLGTFSSTQTPTSILTATTTEQAFTIQSGTGGAFLLAAGDLVIINKPTSQAGLGVGNVRVSASNSLGITFSNVTAATLTPTASQLYSGVIIRGMAMGTATLSPVSVAPNTTAEQIFTFADGPQVGELVQVVKPTAQAGLDIVGMRATGNNLLGITFLNATAAAITPTAGEAYTCFSAPGLDAVSGYMVAQINIGAALAAGLATITTGEIAGLTITGLATTDTVIGVSKDAPQAGLGIAGWRVSAANTLAITWINPTAATLTPTASHVYQVAFMRPAPVAPLVLYNAAIAPVSVAPNTTAEQTFTVTGLIAGTPVWVNKPSFQPGLGIAGVRVSAVNTLAINFLNATAAAITPASETYVVGNFQVPYNSADGVTMLQSVGGTGDEAVVLANAMQSAMVTLGLIAGA